MVDLLVLEEIMAGVGTAAGPMALLCLFIIAVLLSPPPFLILQVEDQYCDLDHRGGAILS